LEDPTSTIGAREEHSAGAAVWSGSGSLGAFSGMK